MSKVGRCHDAKNATKRLLWFQDIKPEVFYFPVSKVKPSHRLFAWLHSSVVPFLAADQHVQCSVGVFLTKDVLALGNNELYWLVCVLQFGTLYKPISGKIIHVCITITLSLAFLGKLKLTVLMLQISEKPWSCSSNSMSASCCALPLRTLNIVVLALC